jgi:hypothetical protein
MPINFTNLSAVFLEVSLYFFNAIIDIKFVGELNRRNLLSEPIIISVLNTLLGLGEGTEESS